jgi:hypothetical protein
MRQHGPSAGFLVVLGCILVVVGIVGLLASAGCEDVGSECHRALPRLGAVALVLAMCSFGYAALRRGPDEDRRAGVRRPLDGVKSRDVV